MKFFYGKQQLCDLNRAQEANFLLEVDTELSEETLVAQCAAQGLEIRTLGSYYHTTVPPQAAHCLVVNYASVREEELEQAIRFFDE